MSAKMRLQMVGPVRAAIKILHHPVAALLGTISRRDETTLARFRSGHTRGQRHVADFKVYPHCSNCSVT
ncbi:hypothetical protein TNCV_5095641 [Trichonephila clavipes]|nr:hypothetical protein TNCV_5095641 [Trichonephila clavipes]